MKHLLLSLIVILSACTQTDDLALYKTNLEITGVKQQKLYKFYFFVLYEDDIGA